MWHAAAAARLFQTGEFYMPQQVNLCQNLFGSTNCTNTRISMYDADVSAHVRVRGMAGKRVWHAKCILNIAHTICWPAQGNSKGMSGR